MVFRLLNSIIIRISPVLLYLDCMALFKQSLCYNVIITGIRTRSFLFATPILDLEVFFHSFLQKAMSSYMYFYRLRRYVWKEINYKTSLSGSRSLYNLAVTFFWRTHENIQCKSRFVKWSFYWRERMRWLKICRWYHKIGSF